MGGWGKNRVGWEWVGVGGGNGGNYTTTHLIARLLIDELINYQWKNRHNPIISVNSTLFKNSGMIRE